MAHRMVLPPLVRAAREAPPAAERTRRQLVDALLQEHERLTALIGWAHGYGDDDSSRLVIASSVLDEYTSLPISSVVEATTGDMTARVIHHLEDWYYHRYDHRVVEVIEEVSDYVGLHGVSSTCSGREARAASSARQRWHASPTRLSRTAS
jgi:hypothetical protein